MACGKKSNNAPTEDFILASPAPVDVAAKISAVFRELSFKVSFSQLLMYIDFHPSGQLKSVLPTLPSAWTSYTKLENSTSLSTQISNSIQLKLNDLCLKQTQTRWNLKYLKYSGQNLEN